MDGLQEKIERLIEHCARDFEFFANNFLYIRDEKGGIEPLKLNKAQLYVHQVAETMRKEQGMVRIVVVKGRQLGMSTYIQARLFWRTITSPGFRSFILTHDHAATSNLYEMAKRFLEHLPPFLKPHVGASSSKELIFDRLDSGIKVGTAGNKAAGRSSTIQLLHGSEVAYWPSAEEHARGILNAVPREPNTEIWLESTANGCADYFSRVYMMSDEGQTDFKAVFVPWFWHDSYKISPPPSDFTDEELSLMSSFALSPEQIGWRRLKIASMSGGGGNGEAHFKREYPCTAAEAFLSSGDDYLISADIVQKARSCKSAPEIGHLILGVDPARFGDDSTAIIRRKGRKAYGLERLAKMDLMQVAAKVAQIIDDEKPEAVCIDVGGLGAGVVDRLKQLGFECIYPVNFGGSATRSNYVNKRAEMWSSMALWLKNEPCIIPDSDALHADITSIKHDFDASGRLLLEPKSNAKKRLGRSPDAGDALALTFGITERELRAKESSADIVKRLTMPTSFIG